MNPRVRCSVCVPDPVENTISNNSTLEAGWGGGVNIDGASSAQIVGNRIVNNIADNGGGIELFAAGTPTI